MGKMVVSTGIKGSTASKSSTISHCLGNLLKASTTTLALPLMWTITDPYSSGKSL